MSYYTSILLQPNELSQPRKSVVADLFVSPSLLEFPEMVIPAASLPHKCEGQKERRLIDSPAIVNQKCVYVHAARISKQPLLCLS